MTMELSKCNKKHQWVVRPLRCSPSSFVVRQEHMLTEGISCKDCRLILSDFEGDIWAEYRVYMEELEAASEV